MDDIWKNTPPDLSEKICNKLIHVRKISDELKDDIVNQWYKFDKLYYNAISMFGFNNGSWILYNDMKYVLGIEDDLDEDMHLDDVEKTFTRRKEPVIL